MYRRKSRNFAMDIALLLVAVLTQVEGYTAGVRNRILNGNIAQQTSFQYHVSIQANGGHLCGGAIISDEFILTAAHCFLEKGDMMQSKNELTVKSGTTYIAGNEGFVSEVERIMVFLDYVNKHSYDSTHEKDIAVVQLKDKLNLDGYYLQSISLPEEYVTWPYKGDEVTIAGYGLTEDAQIYIDNENKVQVDGSSSTILKTIKTQVLDQPTCQSFHGADITEKHICTYKPRDDNDPQRYGECYGDSGSPLAYLGRVVGIVSAGPAVCGDRDAPTIYTRVSYYLDFIRNAMNVWPNGEMVIYKKSADDGYYYWS